MRDNRSHLGYLRIKQGPRLETRPRTRSSKLLGGFGSGKFSRDPYRNQGKYLEWGALAVVVIASLCAAGCHQKPTKNNAIPIGRYVQAPAPGDTVPELPDGETRWWLLSAPTGFELLMPEGASAPEGGE